jgi:hypothetical protein
MEHQLSVEYDEEFNSEDFIELSIHKDIFFSLFREDPVSLEENGYLKL